MSTLFSIFFISKHKTLSENYIYIPNMTAKHIQNIEKQQQKDFPFAKIKRIVTHFSQSLLPHE